MDRVGLHAYNGSWQRDRGERDVKGVEEGGQCYDLTCLRPCMVINVMFWHAN